MEAENQVYVAASKTKGMTDLVQFEKYLRAAARQEITAPSRDKHAEHKLMTDDVDKVLEHHTNSPEEQETVTRPAYTQAKSMAEQLVEAGGIKPEQLAKFATPQDLPEFTKRVNAALQVMLGQLSKKEFKALFEGSAQANKFMREQAKPIIQKVLTNGPQAMVNEGEVSDLRKLSETLIGPDSEKMFTEGPPLSGLISGEQIIKAYAKSRGLDEAQTKIMTCGSYRTNNGKSTSRVVCSFTHRRDSRKYFIKYVPWKANTGVSKLLVFIHPCS